MKKWLIYLFAFSILAILSLQLFMFSSIQEQKDSDEKYFNLAKQEYKIFVPYIPDSIELFGENVPVGHVIVREKLENEIVRNMYWHSHTILLLKRSARFFPVIEPILEQYDVPEDFKYLAMAESELTNAVSPVGASGVWQFMKGTAQEYGLEVNSDVDERYHLEKSTDAACRYLKASKNQFGSWTLAAAAYNMGGGSLQRDLQNQNSNDYYSLLLNQETARYVYRILAIKLICEQPSQYGFFIRNKDLYQPIPVKSLTVNTTISSLTAFAQEHNLSYMELKYVNPWLRSDKLNIASGKSYEISIPLTFDHYKLIENVEDPYTIFGDSIVIQ